MSQKYIREELVSLHAYVPGEQPKPNEKIIKLNTNENPYPPSPKIREKVLEIVDSNFLRKYPNPDSRPLQEFFAAKHGLHPDQVLVTNGSDEALRILFYGTLGKSDVLAMPDPTYSLYPVLAEMVMTDVKIQKIPLLENLHLDLPTLQKTNCKLLAFANPNAPTGIAEKKLELLDLVESANCLVLSDEAYVAFNDPSTSLLEYVNQFPNLVVTQTLSKSHGLAGLRVGFLFGSRELVSSLRKLKDSYNVDMISQAIALAALQDESYFQETRTNVMIDRNKLTRALRLMGFYLPDSSANFVFARPPKGFTAKQVFEHLQNNSIIVRYFSTGIAKDFVRITVGTEAENSQVIETISKLVNP